MTDRIKLAEELEAAEGPSRVLFERAFEAINPPEPHWLKHPIANTRWFYRTGRGRFYALLRMEAWEQAALMLVPHGWGLTLKTPCRDETLESYTGPLCYGAGLHHKTFESVAAAAATPALAIASAALKAGE